MGLMAGKQGLIMGVANDRSLAWGIAKAVHAQGAKLAFTYQGEALGRRVRPLADSLDSDFVVEADVTSEASLDALFAGIGDRWGRLDFVVHAIAFSDKNELTGKYLNTTPGQLPAYARYFVLFVHRYLPPRRAADEFGRQPVDSDLCRRRAGHAALQRNGRREGGA